MPHFVIYESNLNYVGKFWFYRSKVNICHIKVLSLMIILLSTNEITKN
jgi:hypothetical protein